MNPYNHGNQHSADYEANHHGDDQMLCSLCRTPWPCEAFLLARRKADARGSQVIVVEVPRSHKAKRR